MAAAGIGIASLGGCSADAVFSAANPVNWYRSLTGVSKNDPNAEAANNANLQAGSNEPYPDLGSVPSEPTLGLTEDQKKALAQGLVADRDNAHYTDEAGRAGNASATMPAQSSVPEQQLAYAGAPIEPAVAAAVAAPTVAGSSNLAVGGALAPSTPPPPARIPVGASSESALRTPTPRAEPQPELPSARPAAADLKPLPPPGPQGPFPGAPAPHTEPASPEQVAGVPVPPAAPVRTEKAAATPTIPQPNPINGNTRSGPTGKYAHAAQVGQVSFSTGSGTLSSTDQGELGKVPALHKQYGGIVRVVGYAASKGSGSSEQLAAYQAALDHANAVKAALVHDGIPAGEIVTEASPTRDTSDAPERADIYVEY
jgi:outer membrane protein OmpA-like peptidoglycan-associated protein